MNQGFFLLHEDLLKEWLYLPSKWEVMEVRRDVLEGTYRIVVRGEGVPAPNGSEPNELIGRFSENYDDGSVTVTWTRWGAK